MALTATEVRHLADSAGLRYSTDAEPGISRQRRGRGFSYYDAHRRLLRGAERDRVSGLVLPPAWSSVWICMDPHGHLQATGRDAKGRKQYRYHDAWDSVRDAVKFDRLTDFAMALPALRIRIDSDLRRRGFPREKVIALAVAVMDQTLMRVGNDVYAANGTQGLTTLTPENVDTGAVRIEFEYQSKGGQDRRVVLSDRRLASHINAVQELPGQRLFTYETDSGYATVASEDVNAYLSETMGIGVSAKDFRTWGGTVLTAEMLAPCGAPDEADGSADALLAAYDAAAQHLGNTRAVCRDSYVHPAVPAAFEDGTLAEAWNRTRKGRTMSRAERTVQRILGAA